MALEKFEYENIKTIMNEIESIGNQVKGVLAKCESEMNQNLGNISTWSGDAATSVKNKWDKCADNFDEFLNEIKSWVQKMDTAQAAFKKFEESAK